MVYFMKVPVLPFAIGLYLPISLNTAIMAGGLVCYTTKKITKNDQAVERGVLTASGLVAGDSCMGVLIALLTVLKIVPSSKVGFLSDGFALLVFILLSSYLGYQAAKTDK